MILCYCDEAGNISPYTPGDPGNTPVFVVAGLTVVADSADSLLMDYVKLKTRFEPSLRNRQLSDVIQHEIKGASIRRDIRTPGPRNTRRRAIGYLDHVVGLLERYHCRILGRVLVKKPAGVYSPSATYPSAVAELAETLDKQAEAAQTTALMILDAQTKVKNEGNVHTITTRRYRRGGSAYPHLVESPVFGHSDTHILLQLADILASALIFPSACAAYLAPIASDPHLDPSSQLIRQTFGPRLAALEYRYSDDDGNRRGGFRVIDQVGSGATHLLFRN
ncbi:MAG: DUF3800 domain-containing protein [Propionibacteriaceae bacterium]|nr:DUF3800 domain-containing protein [Propionibacteriaceae bacterium]